MKYAYLHRNFKHLSFEKKTIFFAHILTLIFCFFPWFSADPRYEAEFIYNAFSGPTFLMGLSVFLISLIIVLLFTDRLLEKKKIKLPFSENYLYFWAGGQQFLLLVLAWSVLSSIGNDYEVHAIRFGIFAALIAQISGLVGGFLDYQIEIQKQADLFFQPEDEKGELQSAKKNGNQLF